MPSKLKLKKSKQEQQNTFLIGKKKSYKFWSTLRNYRSQIIILSVLLTTILVILILAVITPDPLTVYYKLEYNPYLGWVTVPDDRSPPSWDHLLGTNDYGYDQLTVLIHSLKNSILFGLFVGSICVAIAVFVGVIGPYIGGIVDEIFSLITNISLAFPVVPFILLLNTMIEERSIMVVAIIIALFNWPWAARAIRSEVLSLKERNFVKLAKVTGENKLKIAFFEIVPNLFSYIFLVFIIIIGAAIIIEAGIAMIGLGQQEIVTLGMMLYWSQVFGHVIRSYYFLWIPPGLALTLFIIMIYVVHSSLSQVFNPKLREK
ncbi:MAG: ABC transporter permease [Candidatus Hodarchaeota archaeon]